MAALIAAFTFFDFGEYGREASAGSENAATTIHNNKNIRFIMFISYDFISIRISL